jgi:glutathione peroxidase
LGGSSAPCPRNQAAGAAKPLKPFLIAAKAVVNGPNAHPFYKWAAGARPKDVPRWNFHKYLMGRDGYIAQVFPSAVEPSDTRVKTAIARTLAET